MKRRLYLFVTLAAVVLLGASTAVYGQLGRVSGPSPQTRSLTITVTVPVLVGIYLERNADINLGAGPNIGHYPPLGGVWPGYYEDNTRPIGVSTTNLEAFTNNVTGYTLTVQANPANYYAGLPVSQSFYADYTLWPATPRTADGTPAPPAQWTAFSSAGTTPVASKASPAAWEAHNQIFELQMLGTEPAGTGVVTMTYTIVSNP